MDKLHAEVWSPEKTVGVMIDNFMSYGDLRNLRQAFSLVYEKDHDRFMHPIWLVSPSEMLLKRPRILRRPEPVPPIEKVRAVYKQYEDNLKITVSDDGKVACFRFLHKVRELHTQHLQRKLIKESVGTQAHPHRVTYSFDAFPVENLSIEHGVISSSSMTVPSQSEEFCKIITVATVKENTAGLNRMHRVRRIDTDVNSIVSKKYITAGPDSTEKIFIDLFICVDKKAVEVFRGCAPGCPWCECSTDQRLALAWKPEDAPLTWVAAQRLLTNVCSHPFPTAFDMYAYAHKALPFETLPRYCKFCKGMPYKTVAEYTAHCQLIETERADTDKEAKAKFLRERSNYASKHARQYQHEVADLLVSMEQVIVEIMHMAQLNVAKQCWTKGVATLMSPHMRDMGTQFFDGMGFRLAVSLKSNGNPGTAWFKASALNELVHCSAKVQGGLAPWMASLLFFVGEDFLSKQATMQPLVGNARDDCLTLLKKRYGAKGQQLYNTATLWDCYKAWHDTTFMKTADEAERHAVALQMAVAANAMTQKFKLCAAESGKTWIFHMALYIAPRQVARCLCNPPCTLELQLTLSPACAGMATSGSSLPPSSRAAASG